MIAMMSPWGQHGDSIQHSSEVALDCTGQIPVSGAAPAESGGSSSPGPAVDQSHKALAVGRRAAGGKGPACSQPAGKRLLLVGLCLQLSRRLCYGKAASAVPGGLQTLTLDGTSERAPPPPPPPPLHIHTFFDGAPLLAALLLITSSDLDTKMLELPASSSF